MIGKKLKIWAIWLFAGLVPLVLRAQGNKLSIRATSPTNISICGFSDTSKITVYNISSSVINGTTITLNLPPGVTYVSGSVLSSTVTESNITNLNRPVFKSGKLLLAQSYNFRVELVADCELLQKLGGSYQPQIDVRVDYLGNFDLGSSLPFAPHVPSPILSSVSNRSYTGDVGSFFVRKYTIQNFGKGPLQEFYFYRINGNDLSTKVQKEFTSTRSGDTIKTKITQALIRKVGNKDSFFDRNESIEFTDTIFIDGCKSLNSRFLVLWGCNQKLCQVSKSSGSVSISTKAPNIKSWAKTSSSTCQNVSVANAQELVIANTGQLSAFGCSIDIYQTYRATAGFYKLMRSKIDTTSVFIKYGSQGKKVRVYPKLAENGQAYTCLGANPIGRMVLDLGDIKPGDSIWLFWDMYKCTPAGCGVGFYNEGWAYQLDYTDICGDKKSTAQLTGKAAVLSRTSLTIDAPTDIASGISEEIKYTFGSTNFLDMHSSGKIYMDLILPKTLSHSLNTKDFYISNYQLTNSWYPDSVRKHGDTIRGYFGNRVKMNITNGELFIKVKGDCSNSQKNENLPVRLEVKVNPDTRCTPNAWINMACLTYFIKVHCNFNCSGGMRFKNFSVKRISFGLPDNNNDGLADVSGTLDTAKLRTERAMYGDTVMASFYGVPKSAGGANRTWRYGFAQSIVTYGRYLDVIDAELVVIKGNNVQSSGCTSVRHKKTVSGLNATFDFNFSVDSIYSGGCLSSTYRYSDNDSLILKVRYRIVENLGGNGVNVLFRNRYYLSNNASPTLAQSYQCDTFNGSFTYLGYYFTNYGSDNVNYTTCGTLTLNQSFYLGIGRCCSNYAGNDAFPYEFRNWATMDKLRLHLPKGMGLKTAHFYQYRTTGRGASKREDVLDITPVAGSNNPYEFDLKKLYKSNGGSINAGDDGFYGFVSLRLQPLCDFPANIAQAIEYDYVFERKNALGTGYDTVSTSINGNTDRVTFVKPKISLSPTIQTVYANTDTAEWELRYTNASTNFQAFNIWLSPQKNNNIKVVEIWDADKDTLIKPSSDIYRAGFLGAGKVRRFRVRATYNNCHPDSLIIFGAWACDGYPVDFSSYSCNPERISLFLEPKNTRLQLTIKDSSTLLDLCAGNKMEVLLENIQDVTSYSNKLQLVLPIGMEIIPGSAQFQYPLSSAPKSLAMPNLLSGTTVQWDLDKLITNFSKGFSGTQDTARNKLKVVFRTTTNCDYASGSYVVAKAQANINCGDPVLSIPAYSRPLDIVGINRPYYTLVSLKSDSILPCTKPFNVEVKTIILGPGKTEAKDRIEILLPEGITWDSTHFSKIRNAPIKDSFKISNINGAKLISWLLPKEILPGDSIEFETRFTAESSEFFCGSTDLSVRSVVVQSALCIATNTYCDIKVVTGGELINPVVDKAGLKLNPIGAVSYMITSDTEQVSLIYEIKNTGQNISSGDEIIVKYYFDKNTNGKWDAGDTYLGSDSVKQRINKNEKVRVSRDLKMFAGESCGIIAIIDSSACSCTFGEMIFPTPQLINAGRDTAICSGSKLTLGGRNRYTFTYSWNNSNVLTDPNKSRTLFIAKNQSGKPESYNLVLSTNRGTCFSKDTVTVVVNPLPKLKIGLADTQLCNGSWLHLKPRVESGVEPYAFRWSSLFALGDSTLQNQFIKPDSHYAFFLTVEDTNTCTDSDTTQVKVYPKPKASFSFPVTCETQNLVVTNESTMGTAAWSSVVWSTSAWDTVMVNKTHIPMNGLSEKVQLIVTNDANCADTMIKTVSKKANPIANFTMDDHCLNSNYTIRNISRSDSGGIKEYQWDFGDGSTAKDSLPVHVFLNPGTYPVALKVFSEYGCTDSTGINLNVYPIPKANFNFSKACEGQTLKVIDNSIISNGNIAAHLWWSKYGTGNKDSVELLLNAFDSFYVKLHVTSDKGCVDSTEKRVRVYDKPTANFSVKDVCDGFAIKPLDSSKIADGNIDEYQWNFGDGNNSIAVNPSHIYSSEGAYSLSLRVVSDFGCEDTVAKAVEVYPLLSSSIIADDHCFGWAQNFKANTVGNGVLQRLRWKLGNLDSNSSNNFNYTYAKKGSYIVRLQTITDKGCMTETTKNISVHPLPSFSYSRSNNKCSDEKVSFSAVAGISSGTIASLEWYFRDNVKLSGFNVDRAFATPTNSTAVAVAISDKGCMDSSKVGFESFEKANPWFTVNEVCLDETSEFKDASTSHLPISEYRWDFGDGSFGTGKNASHTYASDGVYNCTHTIVTIPGCEYSTLGQSVVNPKPIPGLSLNPKRSIITDAYITISDLSTGADSVWYRYEKSKINKNRNFIQRFPDSGYYTIHQYVLNNYGCMDSTSDQIYIDFLYTLFVPNAFTPNDRPPNNVFKPEGLGHIDYELIIFDQWGGTIYKGKNGAWDGTSGGEPVPDGVYPYLLQIRDYENEVHNHNGIVHLLR